MPCTVSIPHCFITFHTFLSPLFTFSRARFSCRHQQLFRLLLLLAKVNKCVTSLRYPFPFRLLFTNSYPPPTLHLLFTVLPHFRLPKILFILAPRFPTFPSVLRLTPWFFFQVAESQSSILTNLQYYLPLLPIHHHPVVRPFARSSIRTIKNTPSPHTTQVHVYTVLCSFLCPCVLSSCVGLDGLLVNVVSLLLLLFSFRLLTLFWCFVGICIPRLDLFLHAYLLLPLTSPRCPLLPCLIVSFGSRRTLCKS